MKYCIIILVFVSLSFSVKAQQLLPDNLQTAYQQAPDDSTKFKASRTIYTFFEETNRDSALHYAKVRHAIAKKYNRKIEQAYLQGQMAYQQIYLGRFSEALTNLTEAIQIATESNNENTWELTPFPTPGKNRELTLSMLNHMYGHLKLQTGSSESLHYFKEGRRIGLEIGNHFRVTVADMVLATNYLVLNQPDSALVYVKEGEEFGIHGGVLKYLAYIYSVTGDIYLKKKSDSLALSYYHKSLQYAVPESNFTVVAKVYGSLFNYYQSKSNSDSAFYYANKNVAVIQSLGAITSFVASEINLGKAYHDLSLAYSLKKNKDSTNKYLQLALAVKDSLSADKLKRLAAFQRLTLDEQLRLQNIEKDKVVYQNKIRTYAMLAGIAVVISIAFLLYRNSRNRKKANAILHKQKEELQSTLLDLKATQSQLIQSEKMASLGELTAGIAHEIQNPLNFVNNFSEVSTELVDEMNEELLNGEIEEARAISADIKQNLEKINHHGKRADAIVKGMLQHSRSSSGQKEPTDINALADEYLRLAYHGLRAKDKSFNAQLKTDYDESIGSVNIVPQDIGRVILNLITNAFHAVDEKKKQKPDNYEPTVSVITKKIDDTIEIRVSDNGNGIPQNIIDKIFQPFFTTKPTGQGTGLGLSLAYDIVKAHGGELSVKTKQYQSDLKKPSTTFIVSLPKNVI